MNSIDYVKAFLQRHGHWMMAANVVTKLLGFAAVVFVTRNTTEGEYGAYSYAMNLVGAVVPFMGFGAYQAFLRYASDATGQRAKKTLFAYAFSRGVVASVGLIALLQLLASLLCGAIPESVAAFRIVSFVVLTTLVMEYVKSYARSMHLNHISARIDVTYALILVTATVGLTLGIGILGYAVAVALAPLLAALGFGFKMGLLGWRWEALDSRHVGFWSYGVFTTVGALLAQTFYSVDVFLIGHLVGEKASAVAVYRVALLIPMATSVLPISVAATDFVKNAHQKDNPQALRAYMRGYWKTFGLLSFAALGVLWCLSPWLLTVFGASYAEGATVMRVFLLGSLGAHWLRVPYGHLLSAVGRADLNTYVNGAALAAIIPLCWWAIPVWGIVGAAGAMATMLWVSGGLYALVFELHLRRQSQV